MGTLTKKCQTETLVVLLCTQIQRFIVKMIKNTSTFILLAMFIGSSIEAARLPGCKLRGDMNKNIMELRFNEDSDFTCMKRLLQKGADVNAKDSYDYTPIMYAAKGTSSKALDAVKYLVKKGAELNAKNYYDSTAVELAVLADNGEIVKFLVQKGAEDDLSNLLMLAVRYGKELTKSVKVLVNLGADVNKVCQHTKDTMLIIAAQKNHMEIVKILLEKGADSQVDCKSRFWCLGKDTLIYAYEQGHEKIFDQLKAKGAYPVDYYIFNLANLFPSFISEPIQQLRRTQRQNYGN